jgi:hypothetical protein
MCSVSRASRVLFEAFVSVTACLLAAASAGGTS